MNDKILDRYLRAYQSETDQAPSTYLMENILAIPGQNHVQQGAVFPWVWFDAMMPRVIGWTLTCCLGIYLGVSSTEQAMGPTDEEFYLYDQAQVLISEDIYAEAGDR
ncbi:MAG: hypothetical protein JKY91_00625 [Emcibacter sp.]|nr:hypothetical protein [Emcibacter sp.]